MDSEPGAVLSEPVTRIVRDDAYATLLAFLHTYSPADQDAVVQAATRSARLLADERGALALNVLRSTDGSRVVTYQQWTGTEAFAAAGPRAVVEDLVAAVGHLVEDDPAPRAYAVVYTDDRSPEGVSVISPAYSGAIFVNEITTEPATQGRLLELVIANNEIQSQHTQGYRSANFHRSVDGHRAVNYSLWDTEEQCLEAISAMADMDENLEETAAIANPDFRFYTLAHAWHA